MEVSFYLIHGMVDILTMVITRSMLFLRHIFFEIIHVLKNNIIHFLKPEGFQLTNHIKYTYLVRALFPVKAIEDIRCVHVKKKKWKKIGFLFVCILLQIVFFSEKKLKS